MTLVEAVATIPVGQTRRLSADQARQIARKFSFQPSIGSPIWADHWRAALPDGGCYHLVGRKGTYTLHRDQFDPRTSISQFLAHIVHEAPVETALHVAGTVAVAKAASAILKS